MNNSHPLAQNGTQQFTNPPRPNLCSAILSMNGETRSKKITDMTNLVASSPFDRELLSDALVTYVEIKNIRYTENENDITTTHQLRMFFRALTLHLDTDMPTSQRLLRETYSIFHDDTRKRFVNEIFSALYPGIDIVTAQNNPAPPDNNAQAPENAEDDQYINFLGAPYSKAVMSAGMMFLTYQTYLLIEGTIDACYPKSDKCKPKLWTTILTIIALSVLHINKMNCVANRRNNIAQQPGE